MAKVIGIDLGTTNSCVALVESSTRAVNDKPHILVIPNAEGARTTPSVVGFGASGERTVGQTAKRQAATNSDNTIFGVKRLMGKKIITPQVQKQLELAPYRIVEAVNGDAWVQAHNRQYSPPEISAMVLENIRASAEAYLGEPITDAVITVPAYFDDAQRQATKDAGVIAGLNVRRILNEPTAAALAYGLDKINAELIAVFDLGGGTFDISILEISGGVFQVKAIGGDSHLGGEDFDERLIDVFADEFLERNGIDLRADRSALQRLREAAERAKHELSSSLETEINLPFLSAGPHGPLHFERTLKRSELEILTHDLIERTLAACRTALHDANLSTDQIQNVLLVGGMTRMPGIQKAVERFFNRAPDRGVNPDEVVAMGAALQGAALDGQIDDLLLLDVTPLSIGVETGGGVFTKLIPRNTTIPTERYEIFTTSVDHQSFVPVHVMQGEREMALDNQSLARFELTGIPPAPRGVPAIRVTFKVDADCILNVEAKDLATGKQQSIQITPTSGLSQERIEQLIGEAELLRESDKDRKKLAELKNQAEALLYTTEQAMDGYADLLSPEALDCIHADIETLQKSLKLNGDLEELRAAYQTLELRTFQVAELIYGETIT